MIQSLLAYITQLPVNEQEEVVSTFIAKFKEHREGLREANMPKPIQLELVRYNFIANYPGCDWKDIDTFPSEAIHVRNDNEGAWDCNASHAAGHFLNASTRTTCFGCGQLLDKGNSKVRRPFDIPYKINSNIISEQGFVLFADTSHKWPARDLVFKPGQGASRNPRHYNAAAGDLWKAMQREGITDTDVLGHCRLLVQVKHSEHFDAYMVSKPYLPYATVLEIVNAVDTMELFYSQDPTSRLVPIANDFKTTAYTRPGIWKNWKVKVTSRLQNVGAANYDFLISAGYARGHMEFALFMMISLSHDDIQQVITELSVKDSIQGYIHYFAITKTILEMDNIESGLIRILAYCRYMRVEKNKNWKALEVAWGLEVEELKESKGKESKGKGKEKESKGKGKEKVTG
jgi:hypothetical protein